MEQQRKNEKDFSEFLTLDKFETSHPEKPLIHQLLGWDFHPQAENHSVVTPCLENDVTQMSSGVLERG